MILLSEIIEPFRPCRDAIEWASQQDQHDLRKAWSTCPRGDWMLWIAARLRVQREVITLAGVKCARAVIHRTHQDHRIVCETALGVAEKYALGEATLVDCLAAFEYLELVRIPAWNVIKGYDQRHHYAASACTYAVRAPFANSGTLNNWPDGASAAFSASLTVEPAQRAPVEVQCARTVRETIPFELLKAGG